MTSSRLTIVLADASTARADALAASLQAQGHEVTRCSEASACLAAPEASLYFLGRTLEEGSTGLDLLEALRQRGRSAPVVLLADTPDFAELRRAVDLGASDVLFGTPDSAALARALERAGAEARPRPASEPETPQLARRYPAEPATVGRAAREVSAFLVNEGVAGAHRVRIASALAELVDNACRHAYGKSGGEVTLEVAIRGARVHLAVQDSGRGFDVGLHRLEQVPPALPSRRGLRAVPARGSSSRAGLGRVERLCESSSFQSGPHGTRAELSFELTPVRFEEEPEHLSQTDFLDPERARSLIAALRRGSDLSGLDPAMALTVGRILGGLDPDSRPRTGA